MSLLALINDDQHFETCKQYMNEHDSETEQLLCTAVQQHDYAVLARLIKLNPSVLHEKNIFVDACAQGDVELVKLFLAAETCAHSEMIMGLFDAVAMGQVAILKLILDGNYVHDINQVHARAHFGTAGSSLLGWAIVKQQQQVFDLLLPYFDMESKAVEHAMLEACEKGTLQQVQAIVQAQFEPYSYAAYFQVACMAGNLPVIKYLKSLGAETKISGHFEPFHLTCQSGNLEAVTFLMEQGANINEANMMQETPLHYAVKAGKIAIVHYLLENGALVDGLPNQASPLQLACKNGYADIATILLGRGANVNCTNGDESALFYAVQQNNEALVDTLLLYKADTNAKADESPIFAVCCTGNVNILNQLLKHGANVNTVDHVGNTPIQAATSHGFSEIVQILLSNDAQIPQHSEHVESPLFAAVEVGNLILVQMLVSKGCNVNQVARNETPLSIAIHNGRTDIIQFLLENKANANSESADEYCLHLAVEKDDMAILAMLLDYGASIDLKKEYTPLHVAALQGNNLMILRLLKHGANVNANATTSKETPLHCACKSSNDTCIALLLEHGAMINTIDESGNTPLHVAIQQYNTTVVRLLVHNGANVNICNSNGVTPIYLALDASLIELVDFLLHNKADVNASRNESDGSSLLHLACKQGREYVCTKLISMGANLNALDNSKQKPIHTCTNDKCFQILINAGANANDLDVHGKPAYFALFDLGWSENIKAILDNTKLELNIVDKQGQGALHRATSVPMIELLVKHGLNVNAIDCHGNTSLHQMVRSRVSLSLIECMLSHGANPNLADKQGKTPMHFAASAKNFPAIKLLAAHGASASIGDATKRTPLHCLVMATNDDGIQEPEEPVTLSTEASRLGFVDLNAISMQKSRVAPIIEWLVESGADFNAKDLNGCTPLLLAAKCDNVDAMESLLNLGADTSITDEDGSSIAHILQNPAIIEEICDYSMVNSQNKQQQTPLHCAVQRNDMRLVQVLLEVGATTSTCDANGNTPLHLAQDHSIARLLFQHGASLTIKNNAGHTPSEMPNLHEDVKQVFWEHDMAAKIESCVAQGKCTFSVTGINQCTQTWFNCFTCTGQHMGVGMCETCAKTCHANHELSDAKLGEFYCDCGNGTYSVACKAIKL